MSAIGQRLQAELDAVATLLYDPTADLPPDYERLFEAHDLRQLVSICVTEYLSQGRPINPLQLHKAHPELESLITLATTEGRLLDCEFESRLSQLRDHNEPIVSTPVSSWSEVATFVGSITWAWLGWLANGLLSMLVSEVGQGKSLLDLRIASTYLTGSPWPDGTISTERGAVVWCESESAQAVNLMRAQSWGLPLDKIYSPLNDPMGDFSIENPQHLASLKTRAMRDDVRLVILDSLSGSSRQDENSTAMLLAMKSLADLARDTGKPILLTHHLNKGLDTGDGIHTRRVRGSSSILQLARVVWAIDVPNETDPEHRRLSCIKNNLSKFPEPIGFRISDTGVSFGAAPHRPRTEGAVDRAREFLLVKLQPGAKPSQEVYSEAERTGISRTSINRARDAMGILRIRTASGEWRMSLPSNRSEERVYDEVE